MQKILMILICMFIGSARATEMCAKNNTVVIPLDATVIGARGGYSQVESVWWTIFSYGKVYGVATALSLQEVQEIQNDSSLTSFPNELNTDDDELVGRSGTDANGNNRTQCYCKMTHPMSSNWLKQDFHDPNMCVNACNVYFPDNLGLRTAMFNSIGASMAE